MPRLDADIAALLVKRGLKGKWVQYRQECQDKGHPLKVAQQMALDRVCDEHSIDLTTTETAEGEHVVKVKSEKIPASVFKGKTCSEADCIRWSVDHLVVKDVKPSQAPSSGAWGLLTWARKSPVAQLELYRMFGRLVSPSQAEERKPFRDDGRDLSKDPFLIWLKERYGKESQEVKDNLPDPNWNPPGNRELRDATETYRKKHEAKAASPPM